MKERLDVILVNNGLASSRDNAKRTIMAGLVTVDGIVETKSGQKFDVDSEFKVKDKLLKYVSRGGLKLEKAIQSFNIKLNGCYAVDMGASTGGFTDCMLMNGALKVYALDVGYGQLDYKLRVDPRVINMEKTNIRYLDTTLIEEPIDFISIDVSFISLRHMFPVASKILKDTGAVMCLIKPQFEAGREQVGKKGIVRDSKVHVEVIENVIGYASDNGLYPHGLDYSPVKGTKGNIEYLLYLRKTESSKEISPQEVVSIAHGELDY
ncbi:TlyA family RNA methyltransferase [Mogibacterium diversum]|uniref:TlyA family rRNA (Cytidine-2'-O)-methyltransferase n=1 Tax=Mogibacterium diversum TaxID=114527 RepID=A0A2S0L3G0_9FIRM|nr:TlyA family RNA methyltransferase [Mogibacterium diversum]AVM47809.1 TlyA family rRNA (cytidine-2'-O)-methyltransferase [Mogibacterium diversum]MBF1170259.1 TlyA family RNA methyltransferase [[Eubacterium] sulci]MBF1340629.1 TlyA family RNA methyltransferase [Mogibacterium diversum]